MSEQRWQTVPKKGLKHGESREKRKTSAEGSHTASQLSSAAAPKRQNKPVQLTFEKCLEQMDVPAVCSRIKTAQSEHRKNPELLLREVTAIISNEFSTVQPESDYKFDFLPSLLHEDLLQCCMKTLGLCPEEVLLQCFKYSLDILMTEVKYHRPSYGTRLLLGLMLYNSDTLYKEGAEHASQLLSTCANRVPEALSLLSAILPRSHTSPAAVHVWCVVCIPLFQSEGNVSREVLHYVEQYSSNLLRGVTASQSSELATLITSEQLLKALLSKHFSAKKGNVQAKKFYNQIIDIMVQHYSEQEAVTCFGLAIHCEQSTNECVLKLLFALLALYPSCFQLWAREFAACCAMSCALLNYISQHIDQVNTTTFPRAHIIQFLNQCRTTSRGDSLTLCEELLANIEQHSETQKGGRSSCYVYPAIVVLVMCYLVALGLLLHHLALKGPEEFVQLLPSVKCDRSPHVLLLQLLSHAVRPLAQII